MAVKREQRKAGSPSKPSAAPKSSAAAVPARTAATTPGRGTASPTPRRDAMRGRIEPIARAMAGVGLTANRLTLIGFGIAVLAAVLAGIEWWLVAGIVGTFGAAFDMFDGAVARVTGTAGPLGGFLDATFDRCGEAVLYLGIVVGCLGAGFDLGAWLAAAAMGSAFMVSYTRARAESFGFASGKGMAAVGFAPREVRTVILGAGLVLAGILGVTGEPQSTGATILALALGAIALLATVTTVQRIWFVADQARR